MADEPIAQPQISPETTNRLRDIEEKQRLLKDRIILLGQTIVDDRDKTFSELQQMKKDNIKLKEDNKRMQEIIQRIAEQMSNIPKKEELMTLQRQFDLFREK